MATIPTGKERQFNRRFKARANNYLFDPGPCTPPSGWGEPSCAIGPSDEGERAGGETCRHIREWLFTPLPRFASFDALNVWMAKRCGKLALRKHPATTERSIATCFAEAQPLLRQITAEFEGYLEHMLRMTRTFPVAVDRSIQLASRFRRPRRLGAQYSRDRAHGGRWRNMRAA